METAVIFQAGFPRHTKRTAAVIHSGGSFVTSFDFCVGISYAGKLISINANGKDTRTTPNG